MVLFPLYYAVVISVVADNDVSQYPPPLFPTGLHLENFPRALDMAPLLRYLLNSIIQSSMVTVSHLVLAVWLPMLLPSFLSGANNSSF